MGNSILTVSLFVVCYNHEKFVYQALECARNQTYPKIELIILDDCSTDQSVFIIENWIREHEVKCQFIKHQKNAGVVNSLNECINISTGKYISFFAADDLITADKTERLMSVLVNTPENICLVHGDLNVINLDGQITHDSFYAWYHEGLPVPSGNVFHYYLKRNAVHILGAIIKKEAYDKLGLYDESLVYEDWDMGMRMARNYNFLYVPGLIGSYRKFEGQMTEVYWTNHDKYLRVLSSDFKMYSKHLDLIEFKPALVEKLVHIFLKQVELNGLNWREKINKSYFLFSRTKNFREFFILIASLFNLIHLALRIQARVSSIKSRIKK